MAETLRTVYPPAPVLIACAEAGFLSLH